jgi:hypothetical protein
VATRQRSNVTALATLVQTDDQALVVLETRFTVQNGDGWIAVQDAFVFGVPQFIDTGLLLGQQFAAVNRRHSCRNTAVERAFPAQMGDVGSADHDLGRHTADIDAGAADGAALDQRDRAPCSTAFSAAAIAAPPLPMTATCNGPSSASRIFGSSLKSPTRIEP